MANGIKNTCACKTGENMRHEIIESCGNEVDFMVCCCVQPGSLVGTLREVGLDFVKIENSDAIIPLYRIQAYSENSNSHLSVCSCESKRNFKQAIDDYCNQIVSVVTCFCAGGVVNFIFGKLVEVGKDFLELRFVPLTESLQNQINNNSLPYRIPAGALSKVRYNQDFTLGEDLIIPLPNVCAIFTDITGPSPQ